MTSKDLQKSKFDLKDYSVFVLFVFFQTALRHMATWSHMVTRTHMGKNNDTMN